MTTPRPSWAQIEASVVLDDGRSIVVRFSPDHTRIWNDTDGREIRRGSRLYGDCRLLLDLLIQRIHEERQKSARCAASVRLN